MKSILRRREVIQYSGNVGELKIDFCLRILEKNAFKRKRGRIQ